MVKASAADCERGGSLLEQERARAKLLGYKDPINADYEATSAMYHSVLDECLTRIHALKEAGDDPQKIGIMVASHNADTVRYGVKRSTQNTNPFGFKFFGLFLDCFF